MYNVVVHFPVLVVAFLSVITIVNNCEALFHVPILYAYSRAIRPVVMNITVNYQSVNILSNCISFTVV